jgi:hypothetical protein
LPLACQADALTGPTKSLCVATVLIVLDQRRVNAAQQELDSSLPLMPKLDTLLVGKRKA